MTADIDTKKASRTVKIGEVQMSAGSYRLDQARQKGCLHQAKTEGEDQGLLPQLYPV